MEGTDERMNVPISVLITEDEPVFRLGLQAAFEEFSDRVVIIGEAGNADEAVALACDLLPGLVLLDLRLPLHRRSLTDISWENGISAIRRITNATPSTRILVLSNHEEGDILFTALRAGAHGYIAKVDHYDGAKLVSAIERIITGEAIYGPAVAECIHQYYQQQRRPGLLMERLTEREREVLQLLARRKSNREIAELLVISQKTVKTHVANILAKLQLDSRHEVTMFMRLHGDEIPGV